MPKSMNSRSNGCRAVIAAVVVALASSFSADAQVLKKIAKGLEKVNNGLGKVEKTLQSNPQTTNTQTTSSQNTTQTPSQTQTQKESDTVDESEWKQVEPTYRTPYFTRETKFMTAEGLGYNYSDVHEGVFAMRDGMNFEFWKVTGEKLFDAEWRSAEGIGNDFPIFSGGIAAAKKAKTDANGKQPICLLYLDGRVKELDPSFTSVSQFMDGVALATAKLNYESSTFYIDIAGNKLYPNLDVREGKIRPLCDGLRAYYTYNSKVRANTWGFIDSKGNVKIQPLYYEVTDFCNGYAWATTRNNWTSDFRKELIDVNGKVIFTLNDSHAHTTDVVDGVFSVEESNRIVYYDLEGKELASFKDSNGFYDGYAFYVKDYNAYVFDRNFNTVRQMPDKECNGTDVAYNSPNFKPYGLATVNTGNTVIDPKGNIILVNYDDYEGNKIAGFKQFSESGYAKATNITLEGKKCFAFIKLSGEIAWLFSDEYTPGSGWNSLFPSPDPRDSIGYNDPIPSEPPIFISRTQESIGPRNVETTSFTVRAVANPSKGGSASVAPASGKFKYGEYATISASPNKDWAILTVETDEKALSAPKVGEPFTVIANQTITVNFVKKETEDAPENYGIYKGQLVFDEWPLPVYAEINQKGAEENPYGTNNYGFVSIMFDTGKRYVDKKGEVSVNFFAVPLKIVGIQKDPNNQAKQWLILDGGSITAHDIKLSPTADPLATLFFNMMLSADGFTSVNTEPRRYRVEMQDIDPTTGEFTFGHLEAYSVTKGSWVDGDDASLKKSTSGAFATYTEGGYPADTFEGVKMTKSEKCNDVQWYPPESWSKDKSTYQQMMESMSAAYRNAKTDYEQLFE